MGLPADRLLNRVRWLALCVWIVGSSLSIALVAWIARVDSAGLRVLVDGILPALNLAGVLIHHAKVLPYGEPSVSSLTESLIHFECRLRLPGIVSLLLVATLVRAIIGGVLLERLGLSLPPILIVNGALVIGIQLLERAAVGTLLGRGAE